MPATPEESAYRSWVLFVGLEKSSVGTFHYAGISVVATATMSGRSRTGSRLVAPRPFS